MMGQLYIDLETGNHYTKLIENILRVVGSLNGRQAARDIKLVKLLQETPTSLTRFQICIISLCYSKLKDCRWVSTLHMGHIVVAGQPAGGATCSMENAIYFFS